jgi:hypothetical protein
LTEIIVGIQQLAEKVGIDPSKLHAAESEIRAAKRALESAVYKLDEVFADELRALESSRDGVDEGQIYSTGGGAGQAMRKYKAKPAGLEEVNRNSPLRGELRKLKKLEKKTESSVLKGMTTEDEQYSLYVNGKLQMVSSDYSELNQFKTDLEKQGYVVTIRPNQSKKSSAELVLYVNDKPVIKGSRSVLNMHAERIRDKYPEMKVEIR